MSNLEDKIHAPSCERNRAPLLQSLKGLLDSTSGTLLEIGSGTGQHAVYFAPALPRLNWQPTDLADNLKNIECWRCESGITNISPAIKLDVAHHPWPINEAQAVFTANTLHIVAWPLVIDFFEGVSQVLCKDSLCIVYGPFNYQGDFTSASNKDFDAWLKARDANSGIRDFEAVNELAASKQLVLVQDVAMPANNRLLVWQKK
ncbi:MAG TPA: DUF938 domain-containing protein [Pseudomonadales bacterium]